MSDDSPRRPQKQREGKDRNHGKTGRPLSSSGFFSSFSDPNESSQPSGWSRAKFLDDLPVGCQVIDPEWRYVYVNHEAARHGRSTAAQLVGRSMSECYPGIESTELFATLSRCMTERIPVRMQNRFAYADGTERLFELSIFPNADGLFILSVDQTERMQVESDSASLASIVESSDQAIIGESLDGTVASWNRGAERLFGYTAAEAVGYQLTSLFRSNHDGEIAANLSRVARGDRVEPYETVRMRKDGSGAEVLLSVSPILNRDRQVIGASVIAIDIADRKRAEREARESHERFEMIANAIEDVFWMTDVGATRVYYVSPAYERMWGRTCGELYTDPSAFLERIHPDDRSGVRANLELEKRGESFSNEFRLMLPDGSQRWIAVKGYPIFDKDGTPHRYVGVARDITEHKAAQEQIEEQARLLNVASDIIMVMDIRQRLKFWNRSAERVLGWSADEVLGMDIFDVLGPTEDRSGISEIMKSVQAQGEWAGELHPRSKEGDLLILSARLTLIPRGNEGSAEILGVLTDVTEQRSVERQLLRAQRLESLGALAGGIAHDLNNVLSPILMGAAGIRLNDSDATAQRIIGIIKKSAERGTEIVKQILGFARGVEGERVQVELRHVFRELESIVKETFPKNVQVAVEVPSDLWHVIGDSTQIHQLIMSIFVNARDAMPDGGKLALVARNSRLDEAYARMHIDARPIRYVVIEITDTGQGMPPGVAERIFDPFFTTKPPGKGTGLGLSTALAIVKSHGGFINVYSEVGKGTRFDVYLPASEESAADSAGDSEKEIPAGNGALVLIVEDEAAIREVAEEILESYGYRVQTAADGTEALVIYMREQDHIDVMLIDMMMPNLDGAATIRALRRMNPELPIIAMSGLLSNDQRDLTHGLQVNAFLAKPYTAETLLRTVADVLVPDSRSTV